MPTTIDEIAQHVAHGVPLPRFSASITFDDAYANVVTNALPLLESSGFRGTLVAPAGLIGANGLLWNDQIHALVDERPDLLDRASSELGLDAVDSAHQSVYALKNVPDELRRCTIQKLEDWSGLSGYPDSGSSRVCTEDELKKLIDHGWSIGSHTLTHPMLARLPDAEARREITESRERITELVGERPAGFAYPDGAFSEKHVQMVRKAGYDFAVTTAGRLTDSSQPRHSLSRVYPQPTRSRFICTVTGFEQRLRGMLRL